ncbi:uncharacterized protein LOC135463446 [Liolophura sinensis]|uniref:uncharacterized protein LOC135463446 n=1 Tax=Liolophura sinensis TaxID=3198878 RepID=UPI0031595548
MDGVNLFLVVISLSHVLAPPPPEGAFVDDVRRVVPPWNTTATLSLTLTPLPTHPPLVIRSRYVTKDGRLLLDKPQNESVVLIQATNLVSEEAVEKAAHTMGSMMRHMPDIIFAGVARSKGVRLFPKGHGLVVYPEMASHANTPECKRTCAGSCRHTCVGGTRKFQNIGGLTAGYSYIVDSNVLCKNDGYHGRLNVVGHEFAHLIMFHLPSYWKKRIHDAYTNDHAKQVWGMHSYLMSNQNEYWAESSGAFFMFGHMLWTSGGMNRCGHGGNTICPSVAAAREFIHKKDPDLFAILDYVYTGNRPEIDDHVKPCM